MRNECKKCNDYSNCMIQIDGEDQRMNLNDKWISINDDDLFVKMENQNVMDIMHDFHELYLDSLQYSSKYFNHHHHICHK